MKKFATALSFILLAASAYSQEEVGYNTTDIGAEFQWYPSGTITGLHLAFNSKLHNSFLIRAGYNKADRKDNGEHASEKGGGWGGSLGYRYYFRPFPHKVFIGLRTDIWRMNIDWTDGPLFGETKTWTLQPTFELGYTFIINDQAFITPVLSNGVEVNLKTDGQKVGQGFITMVGISAGFRL